jgi:tetratricopeptide (TPR) repeat protein
MARRVIIVASALAGLFAFCTESYTKTVDLIQNERLKDYCRDEFEWGAPSLPVASKILHREALEDLANGRRDAAVEKLRLAADLSGDFAAPLFTLARVELLSGNPDFLTHLIEGARRSFTGFPGAELAALNWGALAVLALAGAFFALLAALLARHWAFIEHTIVESCPKRLRALPARWILPIAAIAFALLRLGLGISIAALLVVLWAYLAKRERIIVLSLAVLLSAASFAAPASNRLAPAVDPGSVARRLSLVNERSVSAHRLDEIRAVDENRYRAERDFAVGTMMYRLGLYGEARGLLLEAVSVNPRFAPAFINLGNVYFMQGDYDKALAGYRSAVELDSTSAVAHYNIGQAYIKKMLFAQSGVWLERASTLGIETYRAAHPGLEMRSAVVYEQGLPPKDLRRIASAEGRERGRVILSEMLQPFILVPFHRLWAILAAALAAAFFVARRFPKERRAERCDNCGLPACPSCRETIHDVALCRACSGAVQNVSSVKVMEVLLRTRRQKVADGRGRAHRWRTALVPGMAHVYCGRTLTGFLLALAAAAAAGALCWRGLYFKNPLATNVGEPAWETLLPAAVLAAAWAAALLVKQPQEPRNYHIFPPGIRSQEREPARTKMEDSSSLWLSPGSAAPARKGTSRDAVPPPPVATAPKRPSPPPDAFWAQGRPQAPPRPRPAPDAAKEHAGAPKYGIPARPGQNAEPDDFLAEIKKGSSWR